MSKQKQPRIAKEKRVIPLRAAGEKITAADERPSKLLFSEVKKELEREAEEFASTHNQTQTSTKPRPAPNPDQTQPRPNPDHQNQDKNKTSPPLSRSSRDAGVYTSNQIAPTKDFNKRANSIERIALPLGMFAGASKAIYDALYLRTVGAIEPQREIQATRKQLMEWSGIKNIKTINANLIKLRENSLIEIKNFKGEQSGSVYVVKLPEESFNVGDANPDQTQTRPNPAQTVARPNPTQKLDSDQTQKSVWVGLGKNVESKDTYEFPKTLFKTEEKTVDDEASQRFAPLAGLLETFEQVFKELTGKGIEQADSVALQEIAELLAAELRAARLHTKSISKPAAFLAQHLKTRLSAPARMPKTQSVKPDTVGKPTEASNNKPIDLSAYTPEELAELEKEFCLKCGARHEECECGEATRAAKDDE